MDNKSTQQPKSFSDIMKKPKKEYAECAIATVLYQLEEQFGVSPQTLSDILFEYTLTEAHPEAPVKGNQAVEFYFRMTRFNERITSILEQLSSACEKAQETR
jgi:hypothetical protein